VEFRGVVSRHQVLAGALSECVLRA
jgi:hypothetical protein